jgi:UDP-N-acetylglucosamine/UDP-N-acetylgalactosamine diphosphorylase
MPRTPLDESAIRRRVADAGQDHVFRFWSDLPASGRSRLLAELADVDLEELSNLVADLVRGKRQTSLPPGLEPAPFVPLPRTDEEHRRRRQMQALGEELLSAGRVAALVVAGGQGTRLGFDAPKGTLPIGPVSGRSLFQVFADAIRAARRTYGVPIAWYVMTSGAGDRQTRGFFEAHDYFGLPPSDVRFFVQGMMPAVDLGGRLVLAEKDRLAWNPDGHGGALRALARTGMLQRMRLDGADHISYFQVDNPLVPPLDPVFIGRHAAASSDMSSKMARKRDPAERLGHFCLSQGRLHVIEYSDMPPDLTRARRPDGSLRFEAGSIAIHMLSRRFVERLTAQPRFALPFHRAEKRVACVDEQGRRLEPDKPNAVKFETFIFDALPLAQDPVVLEVDRAEEFSPVKEPDGPDSPASAQRAMVRQAARRLEEAGAQVPRDASGEPLHRVEINPLAARNADELRAVLGRRAIRAVTQDLYLGPPIA